MICPVPAARRGFTLIEMLVVMSLLSLLMLALGSALQTIAQTQERVDARLAQSDEFRVAAAFIQSTLGRVSARKAEASASAAAGGSSFLFAAAPDALAWVGVMPARFGAGGRYFFRLAAEAQGDGAGNSGSAGTALVIRFLPWEPASAFPDWSQAESRVLLADLSALSIRYQGPTSPPSAPADAWLPRWSDAKQLPERALLELRSGSAQWPPLVVALRQLPISDARSPRFVIGGGGK